MLGAQTLLESCGLGGGGHVWSLACFFCPNQKMEQIRFSLESFSSEADRLLLSQDLTPARRSPCVGSWATSESIRPGFNV